jgi:hypothetical protein
MEVSSKVIQNDHLFNAGRDAAGLSSNENIVMSPLSLNAQFYVEDLSLQYSFTY